MSGENSEDIKLKRKHRLDEKSTLFYLKFNSVNNSHLFEECRLSALTRPEEQQLDLSSECLTIFLQHPIDFLTFVTLLDLLGAELEPQATSTRPR